MGNIYSAQHVAAYIIYELNELNTFINPVSLQHLLAEVEFKWEKVFGHSAFSEEMRVLTSTGYFVQEVFEAYKEYGKEHIPVPAKEWYLKYGEFQLVYRTYGVPPFTEQEERIVNLIINKYQLVTLRKVS